MPQSPELTLEDLKEQSKKKVEELADLKVRLKQGEKLEGETAFHASGGDREKVVELADVRKANAQLREQIAEGERVFNYLQGQIRQGEEIVLQREIAELEETIEQKAQRYAAIQDELEKIKTRRQALEIEDAPMSAELMNLRRQLSGLKTKLSNTPALPA